MCDTYNRKHVCPRLFDYFVVVGNNKASSHSKVNTPQLLRRYPVDNHKDFELPGNIVYFCQPEGCIQNLPRRPGGFNQQSTSNAFVFALTDKDTNRTRYGICVNFYRQIERHHNSTSNQSTIANSTAATVNQSNRNETQKPLQVDKNNPFLNPNDQQTTAQTTTDNENDQLHPPESPRPESSASQLAPASSPSPFRPPSSTHRHRPIYVNSLTSLCLITHHPFFSSFRECLFTIKRLIERCNFKHANPQFDSNNNEFDQSNQGVRRDIVWSLFTGDSSFQNCEDDKLKEDLRQIEMYILRLMSAPIPIAGRTKLELELIDLTDISRLIFAYSEHTRFSLVDYPLHLPLELLGVSCCLQVLTCILLEHKVILQSSNYNALCLSVMAFVAMLYPLEYMFPVIPLLPTSLESAEQLLLAPTPYLIGIPSSFLKLREKNFRLPNDVWLIDLDANRIVRPEAAEELPNLPEPENTILGNQLKAALQIMSNTGAKRGQSFSSQSQQNVQNLENDVDCVDVAARVAMINFFNSPNMLANFTEHTRTIKLYPRPVVAVQINSFLNSRPKCSPFLSKFIRTQAVEYYAEYVLSPTNVAFLRVQTGVCSPHIVGDKVKWFSQELQTLNYKIWNVCNRQFLNELLSKQTGRCFSPSQALNINDNEYSSDEELSSSSSCSSLTNFANDFFQSEISSSTTSHLNNKTLPVQEMFSDFTVYNPPSMLKLPSETGELINHSEVENENKKDLNDNYLKSDKDDNSSHYSSTSSLSSASDVEVNDELKLFDESDANYAKEKGLKLKENNELKNKDDKGDLNQASTTTTTASSSTSTASSTATIVASNQQANNLQPEPPPRPQQRPNSTSGSSTTTRTTTPHKFHSLDSNIEKQYQKSQNQSTDGTSNQQQSTKPPQRHSGSLDHTSSISGASNRTGPTVIDRTNSACSSPTLSISSVFSRTGSLANSMQNLGNNLANNLHRSTDKDGSTSGHTSTTSTQQSQTATPQTANQHAPPKHQNSASSFLDRFTKEAKSYTRDALQATKKEMDGRKKELMQQIQAFNENTAGNKQTTGISNSNSANQQSTMQQQPQQQQSSTTTSSSSHTPEQTRSNSTIGSSLGDKLASNLSANLDKFELSSDHLNQLNGLADKTSSVLSGFFSGKMVDKVKEKVQQQQQQLQQASRKGLVERTNLIKHSNQPSGPTPNYSQIVQPGKKQISKLQHSENQNFLQTVIDSVMAGEGIGWLKFNRVKNLMEDEVYRNFVVSRLNKTLNHKLSPDDHVQDVEISKPVYKGMLKLLIALIHGLEHTYTNNGMGGMQSTLVVLEIAHTHYWVKEISDEQQSVTTNGSSTIAGGRLTANTNSLVSTAAQSPFGSNENLSSATSSLLPPNIDQSNENLQFSPQKISNAAFETIMEQKQQNSNPNLNRIESMESEVSDFSTTSSSVNTTATTTNCNASETGSLTVNPVYLNRLDQIPNYRNTYSDSELDGMNGNRGTRAPSVWSSKSSVSNGMHYPGSLMNSGIPDAKRTYLFQGLIGKDKSLLWDDPNSSFWEDMFLDAISQERELIGLDQAASEMIERYQNLNEAERKRLEHEEDRLLTNLLHNMVAFMVMLKVNHQTIRRKIRRLLGRCHIGVIYSDEINSLLQRLDELQNNDIDLKPSASRQTHRQTFTLYIVTDKDEKSDKDLNNNSKKEALDSAFNKSSNLYQMCFMEVRDDGLILRNISGTILERWWFERLVNMTYCPKNKTLCLWKRTEGQTHLHKYRSKRSKELYYAIKQAMDKAATRGVGAPPGTELGGEFPVQDLTTGEGGLIQVCMEGVGLLFACSKIQKPEQSSNASISRR